MNLPSYSFFFEEARKFFVVVSIRSISRHNCAEVSLISKISFSNEEMSSDLNRNFSSYAFDPLCDVAT